MTNPALRIGEIAALGKIEGVEPRALINRVNVLSDVIARRLPGGDYRKAIDTIFEQLN
jgi:hypothetical protein